MVFLEMKDYKQNMKVNLFFVFKANIWLKEEKHLVSPVKKMAFVKEDINLFTLIIM